MNDTQSAVEVDEIVNRTQPIEQMPDDSTPEV